MTDMITCLIGRCGGWQTLKAITDVLGPLLLEVCVIAFAFDRLLDYREKRRWRFAKAVFASSVTRIADSMLQEIVPPERRRLELTTSPSTSAFAARRVNKKLENVVPHSRVSRCLNQNALPREDISSEHK